MSGPGPLRAVARLATELQTLRERTGLSLVALAAKTPYSKSTWARYLSGGTLPPWAAVRALAVLASEPEARLRAMWDLAEEEWSGRGVVDGAAGGRAAKSAASARNAASPAATAPAASTVSSTSAPSTASTGPARPSKAETPAGAASATPSKTPVTSAESLRPASPSPSSSPTPATPTGAWHQRRPRLAAALTVAAGIASLCLVAFGIGSAFVRSGDPAPAPKTAAGDVVWGPLGCGGQSCDGRDPQAMNCGVDPVSLGTLAVTKETSLEIRYKGPCQAAWARVLRSQVGDVLSITADTGATQSADITDPYAAESYSYTPMVPALTHGAHLRACLAPPKGTPACVSVTVP